MLGAITTADIVFVSLIAFVGISATSIRWRKEILKAISYPFRLVWPKGKPSFGVNLDNLLQKDTTELEKCQMSLERAEETIELYANESEVYRESNKQSQDALQEVNVINQDLENRLSKLADSYSEMMEECDRKESRLSHSGTLIDGLKMENERLEKLLRSRAEEHDDLVREYGAICRGAPRCYVSLEEEISFWRDRIQGKVADNKWTSGLRPPAPDQMLSIIAVFEAELEEQKGIADSTSKLRLKEKSVVAATAEKFYKKEISPGVVGSLLHMHVVSGWRKRAEEEVARQEKETHPVVRWKIHEPPSNATVVGLIEGGEKGPEFDHWKPYLDKGVAEPWPHNLLKLLNESWPEDEELVVVEKQKEIADWKKKAEEEVAAKKGESNPVAGKWKIHKSPSHETVVRLLEGGKGGMLESSWRNHWKKKEHSEEIPWPTAFLTLLKEAWPESKNTSVDYEAVEKQREADAYRDTEVKDWRRKARDEEAKSPGTMKWNIYDPPGRETVVALVRGGRRGVQCKSWTTYLDGDFKLSDGSLWPKTLLLLLDEVWPEDPEEGKNEA